MSKKVINQNANYDSELLNSIESNFIFDENPINRLKNTPSNLKKENNTEEIDKEKELAELIDMHPSNISRLLKLEHVQEAIESGIKEKKESTS